MAGSHSPNSTPVPLPSRVHLSAEQLWCRVKAHPPLPSPCPLSWPELLPLSRMGPIVAAGRWD